MLSRFESIIVNSESKLGVSIMLILAWIASCDDNVDEKERLKLISIAENNSVEQHADEIVNIAKEHNLDALQLACEVIVNTLHADQQALLLQVAIGMAIADGSLAPAENYILRFIADLVGVSRVGFEAIFLNTTGQPLPVPSDLSKVEFWNSRRSRNDSSSRNTQNGISRHDYFCSVLGVGMMASENEIKTAYRRLSQIHHPDRFSSLGPEAVAAATETFKRINEAYQYLVKHA